MAQCTTPAPCNAGCEETVPCGCTIYKGPVLTTIDLIDGETLCQALEKINSRIRLLSLGTAFPEFTYRVGCMTNVLSPVYLNFLRKNGTNVVTSQVTYANAAALLTYLQTQDSNFAFDTVTKAYIYSGPHLWDMEIVCTVNA